MFKLGMQLIWCRQLIDVMLDVINEVGMYDVIIVQIVWWVGVLMGIISYYFKDKNGLLEVIMCDIISQLCDVVFNCLYVLLDGSVSQCLQVIVGGNFDEMQISSVVMKVWLVFWVSSMYQLMFYWLQQVSSCCLLLNLVYEFCCELLCEQVQEVGYGLVVLIDGLWLWVVFSGKLLDKMLVQLLISYFICQYLLNL